MNLAKNNLSCQNLPMQSNVICNNESLLLKYQETSKMSPILKFIKTTNKLSCTKQILEKEENETSMSISCRTAESSFIVRRKKTINNDSAKNKLFLLSQKQRVSKSITSSPRKHLLIDNKEENHFDNINCFLLSGKRMSEDTLAKGNSILMYLQSRSNTTLYQNGDEFNMEFC
jgi:hypothetical protein